MKTIILTIITIITLSFNSPDTQYGYCAGRYNDGYNRGFKAGYRDAS